MKILIIDDEGPDRKGMAIALAREGYTDILLADTGEAGIEMARTFQPDVVLVDIVLKGADGLDVCRNIRGIAGFKARVIMVTGHLDAVDVKKATSCGADEIIEKTVGFSNIGATIRGLKG